MLLMIDLDGLQAGGRYSFGHAEGYGVLRGWHGPIHRELRTGDFAARLGGDEFAGTLSPLSRPDEARALASAIVAAIHEELADQGVTGTAGIAPLAHDRRQSMIEADLSLTRKGGGRQPGRRPLRMSVWGRGRLIKPDMLETQRVGTDVLQQADPTPAGRARLSGCRDRRSGKRPPRRPPPRPPRAAAGGCGRRRRRRHRGRAGAFARGGPWPGRRRGSSRRGGRRSCTASFSWSRPCSSASSTLPWTAWTGPGSTPPRARAAPLPRDEVAGVQDGLCSLPTSSTQRSGRLRAPFCMWRSAMTAITPPSSRSRRFPAPRR